MLTSIPNIKRHFMISFILNINLNHYLFLSIYRVENTIVHRGFVLSFKYPNTLDLYVVLWYWNL